MDFALCVVFLCLASDVKSEYPVLCRQIRQMLSMCADSNHHTCEVSHE